MLRSLELCGFKSFADRTIFDFAPGITGVVGPNGSGKSNVVDSIKWILGDQSARSLRGKEMTDVIFNGSASRGGAQFAEATLVFDNRTRYLPVDLDEVAVGRRLWQSGDSEYLINRTTARLKDVRELFLGTGAGTASYCIIEQGRVDQILQSNAANRRLIFEEAAGVSRLKLRRTEAFRRLERVEQNLVRLADIVDEVETQVTSLRSQAQRAARYREVSGELEALWIGLAADDFRRESGRQERIREEMDAAARRLDALREQQQDTQRQLDEADARLHDAEDQLRAAERDAGQHHSRRASLQTTREHLAARRAELVADQERLQRQCRLMNARVAEAEADQREINAAISETQAVLDARQQDLAVCDGRLSEVRDVCRQSRDQIEAGRRSVIEQVEANSRTASALTACESELRSHTARREDLERARGDAEQTVGARRQTLQDARSRLHETAGELQSAEEQADRLMHDRQQLLSDQQQSRQSLSELREQRSALIARRTVLEDLEDRQEGFGIGVREILRRAEEADGEPWNQIEGAVADLLDVDLNDAALLEVALSGRSQLLVVRRLDPLLRYLASGRSRISGRVGFVSVEHCVGRSEGGTAAAAPPGQSPAPADSIASDRAADERSDPAPPANAPDAPPQSAVPPAADGSDLDRPPEPSDSLLFDEDLPVSWVDPRPTSPVVRSVFHRRSRDPQLLFGTPGVVGRADGLARSPQHLPTLAAWLLADTWVVESLDDAMRLHARSEGVWRFVTLQGELLERDGTLFAGSVRPESAVMSRKSELRRLKKELSRTEHEIAQREFTLTRMAQSLQRTDDELQTARSRLNEVSRWQREAELQAAEAERSARAADDALSELHRQAESLDEELDTLTTRRQALVETRDEGTCRLDELEAGIQQAEQTLAERQRVLEELEQRRVAVNVELSRTEERLASLTDSRTRVTEELRQRTLQQAEAARRNQAAVEQQQDLQLRELNVSAEIAELCVVIDRIADGIGERARQRTVLRTHRTDAQQAVTDMQEQCRQQESRHHQLDLQLRGIVHELKSAADRIREEYQIEVEDAVARGASALAIWLHHDAAVRNDDGDDTTPSSASASASAVAAGGSDGLPLFDDATAAVLRDPEHYEPIREQIEQQVERLRRRLRNIGHVSADSIDSLTELESRFNRLKAQLTDLESARDALRDIVRRINVESRRMFLESFESVRGHFRDLFRKLFGGGEADLILEDPEEVLECAIDVVARPPGKELRSISLLSGGEKTLTAVALLLSIFRSRPSPYCILDEVDAALDDANIGRFVSVLRDFQQSTQFILITHRKPTMAVTDVLYGVTMEESGISRRLSLRFDDVDDQGNFRPDADRSSRAA